MAIGIPRAKNKSLISNLKNLSCEPLIFFTNFAVQIMESKRQEKFNRQIQKDLGEIFQQMGTSAFGGAFITISGVKVSPDLGLCRVHLSILQGSSGDKHKTLEMIRMHQKEIRHTLAQRIKNQVRKIPELDFMLDESLDYVNKMEGIFKKINEDDRNIKSGENQ